MLKPILLGSAMLVSMAVPGAAQDAQVIDATQVDEVLNIARGYGGAELEHDDNGMPQIRATVGDLSYYVYFRNCEPDGTLCEDINFFAGFVNNKQTFEAINAWNREWRFGKAYLDEDLDAVLEYDVNLEFGVSRKNLDATFSLWSLIINKFARDIGHR